MLECKGVEAVSQHIIRNLSSLYTIQSKSILARPNIPRAEIDEIIRDAHLNDKVEKDMLSRAMAVKGEVDPHALHASGGQHTRVLNDLKKVATQMARGHARFDSRRRYTDLLLYYRPSSDSARKGTKHAPAPTSVK